MCEDGEKIEEYAFGVSRPVACGRTDTTKLRVVFRNRFMNEPKNISQETTGTFVTKLCLEFKSTSCSMNMQI
jgi:hypothetical protein